MTTIVPILTREMLAAARRRSTYAARVLVGVGSVGLAVAMLLAGFLQYLAPTAAGRMFFAWLTAIGYGFALFNGVLSTCDCISREKREGTLGLLFLTQLNAFDIVFGKFIPRFFHLCYCLLAAAPSLAFVFILGGVTAGDFCVAALNLANALFFFAALGMLISTFSRDEKRVFSAAIGLAVLLGVVLPGCGTGFRSLGAGSSQVFAFVSGPAGVLNAWLNAPGSGSAQGLAVGWTFWVNHLLAWLFLLISSGCLSRMVRDTGAGIPKEKLEFVFEKFSQVEETRAAARNEGTGLGLAIVKEAVQAHGGRVWAESEPGHGSRFLFTLPVATANPHPTPGPAAPAKGEENKS
ncbi:MAG: ATP-binding protein [Elusimicrobia bacterium]|nr:ATP-binding protein [Elusimicrobiota bacterium]